MATDVLVVQEVENIADPVESRPAKKESPGPRRQGPAWTYQRNPPGAGPESHFVQYQTWLSRGIADARQAADVDRRSKYGGDSRDLDPARVTPKL